MAGPAVRPDTIETERLIYACHKRGVLFYTVVSGGARHCLRFSRRIDYEREQTGVDLLPEAEAAGESDWLLLYPAQSDWLFRLCICPGYLFLCFERDEMGWLTGADGVCWACQLYGDFRGRAFYGSFHAHGGLRSDDRSPHSGFVPAVGRAFKFKDQGHSLLPGGLLLPLHRLHRGSRRCVEHAVPAGLWTDQ